VHLHRLGRNRESRHVVGRQRDAGAERHQDYSDGGVCGSEEEGFRIPPRAMRAHRMGMKD
jgi:hypothetical protein